MSNPEKDIKPLRIALTKGRLEDKCVRLFEKSCISCGDMENKGRRLILPLWDGRLEAVLAKASDVITYVEHGVCDMGVCGKDTIMESGGSFYELLDLGFGKCEFVLAAPDPDGFFTGFGGKRVATKYPNITRDYFSQRGMDVDIIRIEGSVELAPLLGLSDAIVDITETGATLRENGLHIVEHICDVSARLIVNVASMKMRSREIEEFIGTISGDKT